jgi:putative addiction module CopG family antidote
MNLALKPKLKRFVENQVKAGRYDSPNDVVAAGLNRLMQDDRDFRFAAGELQRLVDDGEANIARGNVLSLQQVRRHFRQSSGPSRRRGNRIAK